MEKIDIIGAGLAGLIAGNVLGKKASKVFERQQHLPNNHKALLRFRSSVVSDRLGIPFKKVKVIKAVANSINPVADAVAYSRKTNGTAALRSLVSAEGKVEERFIAPPDLINRLAKNLQSEIVFSHDYDFNVGKHTPKISTMPMPALMKALGWEGKAMAEFNSVSGISINCKLRDSNFCGTVYLPHFSNEVPESRHIYRASVTGDLLIVEMAFPNCTDRYVQDAMESLSGHPKNLHDILTPVMNELGLNSGMLIGKPTVSQQRYAKILPTDEDNRKRFILWASEHHNVYSLGRFATWRPHLLLDDLINDINVIERLINGESSYDWK